MSNVINLPSSNGDWHATGGGHATDAYMDVVDGRKTVSEAATYTAEALLDDMRDAEGEGQKLALLAGLVALLLEFSAA